MGGYSGDVCREFEDEAELLVDELGNKDSGLHRDPGDSKGVCHDRQYTGSPDSEFTGESEGPTTQNLAKAPVRLPSQIKAVLEVCKFMACIADPGPEVLVGCDNLDREDSGADSDFQGWLSSVKFSKFCFQSATRRSALQCIQHDSFGGRDSEASFLEDLDQGAGRSQT